MRCVVPFIVLGAIVLSGCQSTPAEQGQIEGYIRRAVIERQPAENIDTLVLRADDRSRAAAIGASEVMKLRNLPHEIEASRGDGQTHTPSNPPSLEALEVLDGYKISVLQILIQYGINLNHHYTGEPFFHWARLDMPTPNLLTFLLEHGYDPNLGDSILAVCAYPGQSRLQYDHKFELIKILLKHGANPNAIGMGLGLPILHQFITYNNYSNPYLVDIVELLLDAGADVTVVDKSGRTPLDLAIDFQDTCPDDARAPKLVDSLRRSGAKRANELHTQHI